MVVIISLGKKHELFYLFVFFRYDFEEVSGEAGNALMVDLRTSALSGKSKGKVYEAISSLGVVEKYTVDKIEDFSYTDPIDASVSTKQVPKINHFQN